MKIRKILCIVFLLIITDVLNISNKLINHSCDNNYYVTTYSNDIDMNIYHK